MDVLNEKGTWFGAVLKEDFTLDFNVYIYWYWSIIGKKSWSIGNVSLDRCRFVS